MRGLTKGARFDSLDLASSRGRLHDAGLRELVAAGRRDLDTLVSETERTMRCRESTPAAGCSVTVRYLQQTTRTSAPSEVFAQLVYAFELVQSDPRVVGINLVAPEDDRVALRDYALHMKMLDFLASVSPGVKVALHAGELTLGMVPPGELRFHIRQVVNLGRARRIGHGVSLFYEDDAGAPDRDSEAGRRCRDLPHQQRRHSGDQGRRAPLRRIQGGWGAVTLATDDEGVSRIDLSNEYLRAALAYKLGYRDLKTLSRNALHYSFLPGESIWRGFDPFEVVENCPGTPLGSASPSPTGAALLASSERAPTRGRTHPADAVVRVCSPRFPPPQSNAGLTGLARSGVA